MSHHSAHIPPSVFACFHQRHITLWCDRLFSSLGSLVIPRLLSFVVLITCLDWLENTCPYRDAVTIQIVLHLFLVDKILSVFFSDYKLRQCYSKHVLNLVLNCELFHWFAFFYAIHVDVACAFSVLFVSLARFIILGLLGCTWWVLPSFIIRCIPPH